MDTVQSLMCPCLTNVNKIQWNKQTCMEGVVFVPMSYFQTRCVPDGDERSVWGTWNARNVDNCVDQLHRIYEHTNGVACLRAV